MAEPKNTAEDLSNEQTELLAKRFEASKRYHEAKALIAEVDAKLVKTGFPVHVMKNMSW